MWELVHMPDVSLESDVARVRDPPRLLAGCCTLCLMGRGELVGGEVDYVHLFIVSVSKWGDYTDFTRVLWSHVLLESYAAGSLIQPWAINSSRKRGLMTKHSFVES